MPNIVTSVPAVVDALVALGRATMPDGVEVSDGPQAEIPNEFLVVGFSLDPDEGNIDGSTADMGNNLAEETYTVHHLLSTASGDSDPAAAARARARVAQLFGLYAAGLRADPTLGGVLPLAQGGDARMGRWSWLYGRVETGVYASVEFDVEVHVPYLGAF